MGRVQAAIVLAAVLSGALVGVGAYTFGYARGWSYLTDDPAACAKCHVMHEQHDGWMKGSHRAVAVATTATFRTAPSART